MNKIFFSKKMNNFWMGIGLFLVVVGLMFFFSDGNKKEIKRQGTITEEIFQEKVEETKKETGQNDKDFIETRETKPTEGEKRSFEDQLVKKLFTTSLIPSPKGLAFSKSGEEIWVTLLLNKTRGVAIFDAKTGENVKNINLNNGGGVEIIFSSNGEKAYVSQMETAQIFEIDTASKEINRVFSTESTWTKVLTFSPDEKFLYTSNWVGHDISIIDLELGKTIKRIPSVQEPRGLYATNDGKNLYVAGFKNGEIQKINLETKKGQVLFSSQGAMRHIVGNEEKGVLYISDMAKGVIWKLFLDTGKVEEFVKTDNNPNTIALSPDKKILFVSCRGINRSDGNYYSPGPEWGSVLLFDAENGKLLDAIIAGNQPTALDISPKSKMLTFSNFLDGTLEFYEIPSFSKLEEDQDRKVDAYREKLIKE